MKKLSRSVLRRIIINEMKYTHRTIDDRGDGGYGVKEADRGSLGLEAREALNTIGVDYMDEQGVAFDGDDTHSRVILVQRMSPARQVELILFYKGKMIARALQGQREAFTPLYRYHDAYRRKDFNRMGAAHASLAAELQSRYSGNPLAAELAQKLQKGGLGLGPLSVTDFKSYNMY